MLTFFRMSMVFDFRIARETDAEALATLKAQTWKHSFAKIIRPETLEQISKSTYFEGIRNQILNPNVRTLIATSGTAVAGYIVMCQSRRFSKQPIGEIHTLFVHPDFQNNQLGNRFVQLAMSWFSNCKFDSAEVWTFTENAAAIRFYERCGAKLDTARLIEIDDTHYSESCLIWEKLSEFMVRELPEMQALTTQTLS